jgi:hypothetical protein
MGATASTRRFLRVPLGLLLACLAPVALVVTGIGLFAVGRVFGPSSITPTRAMLVGTWTHQGGAVLVLRPDGTFAGNHLPGQFGDWGAGNIPATGTGTWHIGRFQSDADPGLILDFAVPYTGTATELLVEHCCGLPPTIYYDKGDPDEGVSGQYQMFIR